MTSIRRIVHAIAIVAVVLLVGVFVVQAFPQAIGADHSFVVLSGSMEPTISTGDVVIVSSVPASSIEANDIITYRRPSAETPVTHRVVEVVETDSGLEFVTKGDANEDADPSRVSESSLLGTVSFVIPFAGYVVQFANTRLGQIVLIAGPLGLLVISELVSFVYGRDSSAEPDQPTASEPVGTTAKGEDPSTAEAVQPETAVSETDEASDAIELTTTDLRLSGFAFASFAVYAIWMAYQDPGGLTIGVAMAAVCAVLLIGLVFVAGEPETEPAAHGQLTDGGTETTDPAADTESGDDE